MSEIQATKKSVAEHVEEATELQTPATTNHVENTIPEVTTQEPGLLSRCTIS
jgi:hypothetical protein